MRCSSGYAYSIPYRILPPNYIKWPRVKIKVAPLPPYRGRMNISTRMAVKDLLEILKTNRERHAELYAEAVEGYCSKGVTALQEKIQKLTALEPVHIAVYNCDPPENHTADYDRVIAMLSRTMDTDIKLDEEQYRQLVDDDWDWSRGWANRNSEFSCKTALYASSKGWHR